MRIPRLLAVAEFWKDGETMTAPLSDAGLDALQDEARRKARILESRDLGIEEFHAMQFPTAITLRDQAAAITQLREERDAAIARAEAAEKALCLVAEVWPALTYKRAYTAEFAGHVNAATTALDAATKEKR